MQKLKAELNKVLRRLDQNDGKIKSVVVQKDGNTLIEVDSDSLATWFTNKVNRVEFCSLLGGDITFKTRQF
jgi:hypothetical protein